MPSRSFLPYHCTKKAYAYQYAFLATFGTNRAYARLPPACRIDKTAIRLYNDFMTDKKQLLFWMYYNPDKFGTDIYVDEFGRGQCTPGYIFGETRKNYLLQFVFDGIAHVTVGNTKFSVKKGEAFLLPPNIPHSYEADNVVSTERAWISWSGEYAAAIAQNFVTLSCPYHVKVSSFNDVCEHFTRLQNLRDRSALSVAAIYQHFYGIVSLCMKAEPNALQVFSEESVLVNEIIHWLEENMHQSVTISSLSRHFGYDASSIFRKFKEQVGLSPKEYIIQQRIALAKGLICQTELGLDEIAARCGYLDKSTLNKLFIRHGNPSLAKYAAEHRPPPRTR